MLTPNPNEKILDVGAGKGAVADLVQRFSSSEVHALDPDPKRIASIQRKHPGLKICLSGADQIPYADGFFDKAYTTLTVHHFPEQAKSFRELARILKPEGLLVIADLSPQTLLGRINQVWENWILRYHLTFLSLQDLVQLLKQDGMFEVAEARREGSAYFVRAIRTRATLN